MSYTISNVTSNELGLGALVLKAGASTTVPALTDQINDAYNKGRVTISPEAVVTPTVGASPYTYTNVTPGLQDLRIVGGTYSAVQFVRGGVTTNYAATSTGVLLAPGDSAIITYSVAPVLRVTQLTK